MSSYKWVLVPKMKILEVKASRGERRILKLVIKASKISNAKNSEGRGGWDPKKVLEQS